MVLRSRKLLKILSCAISLIIILVILINSNKTHQINIYEDDFIISRTLSDSEEIIEDRLVNFTGFKYIINNNICNNFENEILGIILVTSYVGHDELRSAHRRAISQEELKKIGFLRIFLTAAIPMREKFITQKQLLNEQNKFNDLIQGNFLEAYRNLTYKHTMGLKWAVTKCKQSKFIIKIDDDTVFDIYKIQQYLKQLENTKRNKEMYIAGYILDHQIPIRVSVNKWFVSKEEYSSDTYPDYLSGWLYITNPTTATKLIIESQVENFFWIDDTFFTGILRNKLNIPLIRLNEWYSANSEFLDCCVRDFKAFHYECDYFVGPNGGDTKLIEKFIHEIKKCYFGSKCIKRSPEKSLKLICVAEKKNIFEDHGNALVRAIKMG